MSADQVYEIDAFGKTLNALRDDDPLAYNKFAFYLKGRQMPTGPKRREAPADVIGNAVMRIATGEER